MRYRESHSLGSRSARFPGSVQKPHRPQEMSTGAGYRQSGKCVWDGLLLTLLLCACFSVQLSASEVARVGDRLISADEVKRAVARRGYNVFELGSAKRALDDLIDAEVLALYARQQGYENDPEVAERIRALLVEKVIQEKVDKNLHSVTPGEEEIKAYYEAHTAEFGQPGTARAQVLTLMVKDGNPAEALARANGVMSLLHAGQTLGQVASKQSDDPAERVDSGAPIWFTEGRSNRRYPAEVTAALFKLSKAGELAGPIQTSRGVYLVQLLEKRPSLVRSFSEARQNVLRAVQHERRLKAYAELCAGLRQTVLLKVNDMELTNALEKFSPASSPPRGPVAQ